MNHSIQNTDPNYSPVYVFESTATLYYDAPGLTVSDAEQRNDFAENPLVPMFGAWDSSIDSDGDGVPDATDAFPDNADEWEDADSDGLGDNFEQLIIDFDSGDAFDSLDDVDPDDDFDGDDVSNADEFAQGTDPTDATSALPVGGTAALVVILCLLGLHLVRRRFA